MQFAVGDTGPVGILDLSRVLNMRVAKKVRNIPQFTSGSGAWKWTPATQWRNELTRTAVPIIQTGTPTIGRGVSRDQRLPANPVYPAGIDRAQKPRCLWPAGARYQSLGGRCVRVVRQARNVLRQSRRPQPNRQN